MLYFNLLLCGAWLQSETDSLADLHQTFAAALHDEVGVPMNRFKEDQTKLRRQYLGDAYKLDKEQGRLKVRFVVTISCAFNNSSFHVLLIHYVLFFYTGVCDFSSAIVRLICFCYSYHVYAMRVRALFLCLNCLLAFVGIWSAHDRSIRKYRKKRKRWRTKCTSCKRRVK